jgi:hypothetical protein
MRRVLCIVSTVFALVASAGGASASNAATGARTRAWVGHALFEGRWIDLGKGWGAARACLVYPHLPTECFRTVGELEELERSLPTPVNLSCSTPLRLHDGTYQTGTTVSIYSRGLWINLSTLSFDNMTSSYTVGACAVELAAGSSGGGSHYTRCLSAGCVENVMAAGWDNVISSVYLH